MNSTLKNILEYSQSDLESYFTEINEPEFRADQVYKGIFSKNWNTFSQFTVLSKPLRSVLDQQFYLRTFKQIDEIRSDKDGTKKFLWELPDERRIESVIIYEGRRVTFCISSQVGCPLDCRFCATGKMGLLRNLTAAEIIEQVLQMKEFSEAPPTNIVFMGMGEPMLNYDSVMQACDILADPQGLCFNRKKITVSTSGIVKGIRRMADENRPYSLAVSLNAVSQEMRSQIMPVSQKYPMDQLMESVRYYTQKTDKRVTFEYVLIKGINSSEKDARELVKLTHGIPCKVNIIPCNSEDPQFAPPEDEEIQQFDSLVNKKQRTITIRNRKGWDIKAACGQLYAANKPRLKTKKNIEKLID